MNFIEKLSLYSKACFPVLWVSTYEETRLIRDIKKYHTDKKNTSVYEWNCIDGLYHTTVANNTITKVIRPTTVEFLALLTDIATVCRTDLNLGAIFIIKDAHLQFEKVLRRAEYITAFKNLIPVLKSRQCTVLFVACNIKIPNELIKDVQLIEYSLPDETVIRERLDFIEQTIQLRTNNKGVIKVSLADDIAQLAVEAAKGLTATEVENAFAVSIVEHKQFNSGFVKSIFKEKVQTIKKSGFLTHLETDISFDKVGGLQEIKKWIQLRKNAYSKKARNYKLPYPRGLGIAGISGTGKTLITKAIANEFGFPLFQLDIGKLFSKLLGDTEANFAEVIKVIESIGNCVILLDEIERFLSEGATSGDNDSGASSRSFGTLLSWLSDRTCPAFIVFTSNNHLILPTALIRKGRFDELFWVDNPVGIEREEIYKVIINKFERDVSKFDIAKLVKATTSFTGAELNNTFEDAMFKAFADGKEITNEYIINEIAATTPQAVIKAEEITNMRRQAKGKLKSAGNYTFNSNE